MNGTAYIENLIIHFFNLLEILQIISNQQKKLYKKKQIEFKANLNNLVKLQPAI